MTLTKEEVEDKIDLILDSDTGSDCTVLIDELLAHDQAQRAVIEQQTKEIERLRAALTIWQSLFRKMRSVLAG